MFVALLALSSAFAPAPALRPVAVHRHAGPTMDAAALGRRAAVLGIVAAPLAAHADAIADIAAKNAEAAAAAKTPEALQAIKDKEDEQENGQLIASGFITVLLLASTALSLAPVSENVKRVGDKVRTGKGRQY